MALRDVIEEVKSYILDGHSDRANEQETKEWFISPILRELGWVGPNRLASESRPGQERTRMDYSLLGPQRKPLALIEAKASRRVLAENDVTQMLNYDFHQAGVDICILTNGLAWWLYLPREKGNPPERRFAAIDLQGDEVAEVARILESCLDYEALTTGAAEKRAKEMLAAVQLEQRVREEIPHAWQRIIEEPNEILIELVQEEVQDELGERPSERQVREELLAIFKRERSPIIAEPRQENPSRPLAPTTQSPAQTTSRQRGNRPKVQVREFRLWEQTYQVRFQYEVLTLVADAMYDRHKDDFAKVLQLSRFHDERGKCTIPHRIGDSEYFVDRNLDFEKMKLTCERLLEHFGYSADDLDITTED